MNEDQIEESTQKANGHGQAGLFWELVLIHKCKNVNVLIHLNVACSALQSTVAEQL